VGEAAPLVIVDCTVRGESDALDVVGNAVGVVVVERRRVDSDHDVVDNGAP
jgi:hypothetical protein